MLKHVLVLAVKEGTKVVVSSAVSAVVCNVIGLYVTRLERRSTQRKSKLQKKKRQSGEAA